MFVRTAVLSAVKSALVFWGAVWSIHAWAPEAAQMEPESAGAQLITVAGGTVEYMLRLALWYPDGIFLAHAAFGIIWAFMIEVPLTNERSKMQARARSMWKKR
jgi:hypothetical protein